MSGGSTGTVTPLTIATRFVQQYYNVLVTTPEAVYKFYQPNVSTTSLAHGSEPTEAQMLREEDNGSMGRRFSEESAALRFEFDEGAIDAQDTQNGAILIVVTGHVVEMKKETEVKRGFVHTFILAKSSKKYYVHNDILRFLVQSELPALESETVTMVSNGKETPVLETSGEEKDVVEDNNDEEDEEAPGGGVEESKEEVVIQVLESTDLDGDKEVDDLVQKATLDEKDLAPSSWATMVKRTGSSEAPTPAATPVRKKAEKKPSKKEAAPVNQPSQSANKRDPSMTLVLRPVPAETTVAQVKTMLEPFAILTDSKIIGCTVSQKGMAFLDYSSAAAAVAALEAHEKKALIWPNGDKVEMYQKKQDHNKKKNQQSQPQGQTKNGNGRGGKKSGRGRSGGGGNGRGNRTSSRQT